MQEKIMIIMRGVPGSGKSFKTGQLKGDGVVFSTDDFWGSDPQAYVRNFTKAQRDGTLNKKLMDFHFKNLLRTTRAMGQGISPIIVDNTNIMRSHFEPYIKAAQKYGYAVRYEEPDTPMWQDYRSKKVPVDLAANYFAQNNQHGVPQNRIADMLNGFEEVS